MHENFKKAEVTAEKNKNLDVSMMSVSELAPEYTKIENRYNVIKELSAKLGIDDPALLEERRKLDDRKAALDERMSEIEASGKSTETTATDMENEDDDPFSKAVSRSSDGRVAKRIENWRDGQIQ